MDVVAHVLWATAAAAAARCRFRTPIHLGWTAAAAALPDLVPFAGPAVIRVSRLLTGAASSLLPDGSGPRFDWVWGVYNATHSAVLFGAVFALVWFLRKRPPLEMLGWALHIATDIFTHTGIFAVRFLWPWSPARFDGIRWETPWLLAANYAALGAAWLWLWWAGRVRGRASC